MKHRLLYIPILFLFLLSFADCAKKGSPSGGKRDSIPPVIVKSSPENYSVNFVENEIRIYFDEYIKLKDLQKELIISPPFKNNPIITPTNASKILKIRILDTLLENTTYSLNFGNSIVDNNEENEFKYFKYVFSTGSYIDSLKVSGKVKDALLVRPEIPTTLLLHEIDDDFSDSLVLSEKPTYITTTRDSTSTFEFTNLKEGNYLLLALKEKNNDYTFQPQTDKIAFTQSIIRLPTDSTFTLNLFKEEANYSIARPKHESKHHITFGYQGDGDNLSLELLSEADENFEHTIYKDNKTDTLHYWFKPEIEADTLIFVAKNRDIVDTLNVRMRNLFKDSLEVSMLSPRVLTPKDTLKLAANTPLTLVDDEKITVLSRDSITIEASLKLAPENNLAYIIFPKQDEQSYRVQLFPGALTDYYSTSNDSLKFNVVTKAVSDYGTLTLNLNKVKKWPVIVQLINEKFKVISESKLSENKSLFFDYINPGKYYIRIVFDENKNGVWDTGNFLKRLAPEEIKYYPSLIEIRANWSLNETFILD